MKLTTIFRRLDRLFSDKTRWAQDQYLGVVGAKSKQCYCLAGGLAKVQGNPPCEGGVSDFPGKPELMAVIHLRSPGAVSVEQWNDHPDRTIGEVRSVVREALRIAERNERKAA